MLIIVLLFQWDNDMESVVFQRYNYTTNICDTILSGLIWMEEENEGQKKEEKEKLKKYRVKFHAIQKGVAYVRARNKTEVFNKFLEGKIDNIDIVDDGDWEIDGNIEDAVQEI